MRVYKTVLEKRCNILLLALWLYIKPKYTAPSDSLSPFEPLINGEFL